MSDKNIDQNKNINLEKETKTEDTKLKDEKQPNDKKYKRSLLIAISMLFIIIVGNIIRENKLINYYENKVYPTTTINNLDVSNLEINDLKKQISKLNTDMKSSEIIIKANNKQYSTSLKDLGYTSNANDIASEVFNYAKDKKRRDKFEIITSKTKQQHFLDINLNEDKLKEFIANISKETNIEPTNPTIKLENGNTYITAGKEGQKLDEKNLVDNIKKQLANNTVENTSIKINANYIISKPSYNKEYLQSIDTKISSYTTNHSSSQGRTENLKNAASKINNKLLLPGEVFSYSDSVGPISTENGYKNATVIIDGKLSQGLGGGICQVSSTLYNTQLKAGILPTQRRNHSLPVAYVPRGLDATVASGIIDYKFENTLDYPLLISAHATNNQVVVEFWSNKEATQNITYKPISYVSGKTARTYLYGYDEEGKEVSKEYIDTSTYR